MAFSNPYVVLVLIMLGLGYWVADTVKAPIDKAAHVVKVAGRKACHVVSFGKKCAAPEPDDATPQP